MRFNQNSTSRYFRETSDGKMLFFPHQVGRGYFVKTPEGAERIARAYNHYLGYSGMLGGAIGGFSVLTFRFLGLWMLLALFVPIVICAMLIPRFFLKRFAADLEPSTERYSFLSYYRNMARNTSWPWLIFAFLGTGIAVIVLSCLPFLLKVPSQPFDWSFMILPGMFSIFPAFMFWQILLKRRQEKEEAMLNEEE